MRVAPGSLDTSLETNTKSWGSHPTETQVYIARYFDSMYSLGENGDYDLEPWNFGFNKVSQIFFDHGMWPRRKGGEITRQHKNFAAGATGNA